MFPDTSKHYLPAPGEKKELEITKKQFDWIEQNAPGVEGSIAGEFQGVGWMENSYPSWTWSHAGYGGSGNPALDKASDKIEKTGRDTKKAIDDGIEGLENFFKSVFATLPSPGKVASVAKFLAIAVPVTAIAIGAAILYAWSKK